MSRNVNNARHIGSDLYTFSTDSSTSYKWLNQSDIVNGSAWSPNPPPPPSFPRAGPDFLSITRANLQLFLVYTNRETDIVHWISTVYILRPAIDTELVNMCSVFCGRRGTQRRGSLICLLQRQIVVVFFVATLRCHTCSHTYMYTSRIYTHVYIYMSHMFLCCQ